MNILIIYYSSFGNTQLIAESIAETLRDKGYIRLIMADKLNHAELQQADLVIVGSPIYRHSSIDAVKALLKEVPDDLIHSIKVAAFDVHHRMARGKSGSTERKITEDFQKDGVNMVVPPESFFVVGHTGPLEEGEIERAKEWAMFIAKHVDVHSIKRSREL
jgi:flavodoxin